MARDPIASTRPPLIAEENSDGAAGDQGQQDRRHADRQRIAPAPDDPRKDVAPVQVDAEPVDAHPGRDRRGPTSVSVGSNGAIDGAKTAQITRARRMMTPTEAPVWWVKRRTNSHARWERVSSLVTRGAAIGN